MKTTELYSIILVTYLNYSQKVTQHEKKIITYLTHLAVSCVPLPLPPSESAGGE